MSNTNSGNNRNDNKLDNRSVPLDYSNKRAKTEHVYVRSLDSLCGSSMSTRPTAASSSTGSFRAPLTSNTGSSSSFSHNKPQPSPWGTVAQVRGGFSSGSFSSRISGSSGIGGGSSGSSGSSAIGGSSGVSSRTERSPLPALPTRPPGQRQLSCPDFVRPRDSVIRHTPSVAPTTATGMSKFSKFGRTHESSHNLNSWQANTSSASNASRAVSSAANTGASQSTVSRAHPMHTVPPMPHLGHFETWLQRKNQQTKTTYYPHIDRLVQMAVGSKRLDGKKH